MGTRPRTVPRVRKGSFSGTGLATCRRLCPSVAGKEGLVSGCSGPPCRGSSAQGWGDQTLPLPLFPGASGYFLPPAVCFGSLPSHGTLLLLSSPALWGPNPKVLVERRM